MPNSDGTSSESTEYDSVPTVRYPNGLGQIRTADLLRVKEPS